MSSPLLFNHPKTKRLMGKCKFLLGLGIGSVVGALLCQFARTDKAKAWKEKMYCAASKAKSQAADAMDAIGDKAKDMADRVG